MDGQVTHGSVRQIELQRLPVVAVIERDVDGGFGSGKEQALAKGIFADDVDRSVVGKTLGDFDPGLAIVAGAIDVRA